jgi:hypothetical protein
MVLYDNKGTYLVGGQLLLTTRKGHQIPNDRRPEQNPVRLEAAKEQVLKHHKSAQCRSLTSVYNCMGMVFANRRTCIDPDNIRMILKDDEYRQLQPSDEVVKGDVVIYKDSSGHVSHVGLVIDIILDIAQGTRKIKILSQWGQAGEYFHDADDVHQYLGTPEEYWTDRR